MRGPVKPSDANTVHAGVVFDPGQRHEPRHEAAVHLEIAKRLARLQGIDFLGTYQRSVPYPGRLYFVPNQVLVGVESARRLGVDCERDLFGGVVPEAFMATKAITHPLFTADSRAPSRWSRRFSELAGDAVLRGFTTFSVDDAYEAGRRLLEHGPVRLKTVRANAGRGQATASDMNGLTRALADMDELEVEEGGLVLEEHLEAVKTYSVGQVRVGDIVMSYYGSQRLTANNDGDEVYGGTDLVAVRGGFDALLRLPLPDKLRLAVVQAEAYDAAARTSYPDFFASRRNYDIAQGRNPAGRWRSGVLEQSWRMGGASSAELVAMEALQSGAVPSVVRAASVEVYGRGYTPPTAAIVLFRDDDPEVGFITKFVMSHDHDGH